MPLWKMVATWEVAVVSVAVLVVLLEPPPGGGGILGSVSADKQHKVGGKQHWSPGVNYTVWADRELFHLNDWLVFQYQKGMYDVLQVNETAYNHCLNADPIRNDSKGRSYAVQLNRTGWWYFICSKGYCSNGMKLAIKVEPLPPPSATADGTSSGPPAAAPGPSTSAASGSCRPRFKAPSGFLRSMFWLQVVYSIDILLGCQPPKPGSRGFWFRVIWLWGIGLI